MIQTSLAAALLVASAGSPAQDQLLDLLPAGAPFVVAVGDVAGHLDAEDPAMWIRFVTDDRMRSAMLELTDVGEEFADQGFEQLLAVVSTIRGGGIALTDIQLGGGAAVLRVTDEFIPAMRTLLDAGGEELVDATVLGLPGHRVNDGDTNGMSMVEVSGLMLIGIGMNDVVESDLSSIVAAMEDGPNEERWWTGGDIARVDDPLVELFLSLGLVADIEEEFDAMFPNATVGYLGMGVGEGASGEMAMSVGLGENDVFSNLAGAFGTADRGLMRLAPSEALSVAVLNVDLRALIETGLEMAAYDEARETYEMGIAAGSSTLGVDLEEDILGNLTGDIVMVQWTAEPAALASDDPAEALEAMPALAFGIEDSEPFFTLIETAEGLMGPEGLAATEVEGGTLWSAEPLPGMTIGAALTDSMLILGATDRVEELLGRVSLQTKGGMLDEDQLALADDILSGAYIGVADMATTWDLMASALELEPEGVPDFAIDLIEAAGEHLRGIMYVDTIFAKGELALRMVTR